MKIHRYALASLCLCACRSAEDQTWTYATDADGEGPLSAADYQWNEAYAGAPSAREASFSSGGLAAEDERFAEQAAQGGLFEVESSNLALEKDVSDETREIARTLLDDHGRANRELMDLAERKDLWLPTTLDPTHQEKVDDLASREGAEFEEAYLEAQRNAHDEAIALFEEAARECRDLDLRAFAERTLPTLREHREMLQR